MLDETPASSSQTPLLPHLRQVVSSSLGLGTDGSRPSGPLAAVAGPASALLQCARPSVEAAASQAPAGHTEERVVELVHGGQTRRDALRQVTRENMDAEIREGLSDTLQSGTLPSCARACGVCCGVLMLLLLVALVLLCIVVFASGCAMNLAGWFLTWWLLGCGRQRELRAWLLVFQASALLETLCGSLLRGCGRELAAALDARVRPGCGRAAALAGSALCVALKVLWCLKVQAAIAQAPEGPGCGEWLPRFVRWYSCIHLLQLLVVEPTMRLGTSIVLWIATTGFLQTTRGAKPGTLESLQILQYDAELFADVNDPSDGRPQRECCFCLEEYDNVATIIRTPCQHIMHRECLGRWLQTSHFCPICRGDLEESRQP